MIIKHFSEGGAMFMSLIYMLWIAVVFLVVKTAINTTGNKPEKLQLRQNSWILFLGSFGFLLGIFGQMIGLFQAMRAVENAGDISPALIAGGLKVSLIAPLYGFALLLVSGIAWFVLRKIIQNSASRIDIDS